MSSQSNTNTFAYYVRIHDAWVKSGRKKHVVDAMKSLASTGKVTSYACFGMSCLCCCCCTKCGQACMEVADTHERWAQNMAVAYQGVSLERTDAIFASVMKLLVTVKGTVQDRNGHLQSALATSVSNGSMEDYKRLSMQSMQSNFEYSESAWLATVMKQVHDRVSYGSERGVLTLLDAEQNLLLVTALPMFYSGFLDEKVLYVIRQNALNAAFTCL